MKTEFEHKFTIGDTVFLIFYSRGKYRVRKKTGYKIRDIAFRLYEENGKAMKWASFWFEGNNPSVYRTEECACFATLEEAEKACDEKNRKFMSKKQA